MYFDNSAQRRAFLNTLKEFALVLLFTGIVCLLGFISFGFHEQRIQRFSCDAECVQRYENLEAFYSRGQYYPGGAMQSDRFAYSGTHSMKLTKEDPYGFQFEIPYLKGNETITISVWRFSNGKDSRNGILVAAAEGMWKGGEEVVEKSEHGWEKIQLTFNPPKKSTNRTLKIYCWNRGYEPIYFDDLEIEVRLEEAL